MDKKILGVCLGFVFASAVVPAVFAENLWTIYELAKKNDPTYAAAVAQYHAEQEQSPQAWAPVLPQLNVTGIESQDNIDRVIGGNTVNYDDNTSAFTVRLTQTLFDKAKFNAISQADYLVAKAEADYNNAADELILRAATNYFQVLTESENVVFAEAETKAIAQQLNQAKQRFNVGLTAITDVHEAQARYDTSVSAEIEARRLLATSRETLRELTNEEPGYLAKVKPDYVMVSPEPDNIDTWVKSGMENNLLLLSAKKAMEASREAVDVARSGHYPTLDFKAEYTDSDSGPENNLQGTTLSLELNLPLYLGGAVNSSTRQYAALYVQSKELYEKQRRATERLTRNSYLTVLSSLSQVAALKQSLISTQTALEATQAGFDVGTRTAVEVLDSQREMFRAQRDYIRARHAYILATLVLKQAAGTLNDEDVKLINNWLE